jgi:hypothetical protein
MELLIPIACVVVAATVAVALVVSFVRLWRRGRWAKIGMVCAGGILGYAIFDAVHPPDSFYKKEFQDVSGLRFPRSGRIVCSHATYPDGHGDYESWALFEVEPADFEMLEESLATTTTRDFSMGLRTDASLWKRIGDPSRFRFRTAQFDATEEEFKDWGTLDDGKSVVFRFVSW